MALNLRQRPRQTPQVSLTPLIDVVFLLLIFFMVSTTFDKQSRIKVELPEATTAEQEQEQPQVIDVTVDAQGHFYVNQDEVVSTEPDILRRAIEKAAEGRRDLPVIINADGKAPHQAVITVIDVASQLGLLNFRFAATQPAPGGGE